MQNRELPYLCAAKKAQNYSVTVAYQTLTLLVMVRIHVVLQNLKKNPQRCSCGFFFSGNFQANYKFSPIRPLHFIRAAFMESYFMPHLSCTKTKEMENKISIPKPCHEDWNNMLPAEQGRHCLSCSKTVIDFSNWATEDILSYLQYSNTERVCGRFNNVQVITPEIQHQPIIEQVIKSRIPFHRKIAAIIILCFSLLPFGETHAQKIVGKIAKPATCEQPATKGEIVFSDTTQKDKTDTIKPADRPQIMGMIAPYKPPVKKAPQKTTPLQSKQNKKK